MIDDRISRTDSLAPSGVLKVLHLRRFWDRQTAAIRGERRPPGKNDLIWDRILLDGLGVALEDTRTYLRDSPALEEFERWILAKNGGSIDAVNIRRINETVSGSQYSREIQQYVSAVDATEKVLTKADLEHWDEHGYVILRKAITGERARAAEEAVWKHLGMTRDDPGS